MTRNGDGLETGTGVTRFSIGPRDWKRTGIDRPVGKAQNPTLRHLLFEVTNGDRPATSSQELYELAWEHRIRSVDERRLKVGYGRGTGRSAR
jgi:hypothetical protein